MRLLPRLMKMLAIASIVVFCISMMRAFTVPVWAGSAIAFGSTSEMSAMTSQNTAANLGNADVEDGGIAMDALSQRAGSLIQLNTACEGITTGANYFGRWKPLGRRGNKAKCKEGAGGQPNDEWLTPHSCRIATINDGNFDNGTIIGAKCVV